MKGSIRSRFSTAIAWACFGTALVVVSLVTTSPAQIFTPAYNNSIAQIDFSSSGGMSHWPVNGVNQLAQEWFWYRAGSATLRMPINTRTLYTKYYHGSFGVVVHYVLTGSSVSSGQSHTTESISITNSTSDFDLGGTTNTSDALVAGGGSARGTLNSQSFPVTIRTPGVLASYAQGPAGSPTITTQPANQVTTPGSSVTLSVGVSGGAAYSYQWRLNGVPIPGATAATLPLANLTEAQAGEYDVVVSGGGVSVTSSAAKLVLMEFNLRPVVSVLANSGTRFRVEYSSNLTNGPWLELTNGVTQSSRQDVIDFSNSNALRRFYRVVLPAP